MLQLDAAGVFLTVAPFFLSEQVPPLLNNLLICRLLNCITDDYNHVHRYIIAPHRTLIGHSSGRTLRYLHETIPYMVNHLTDLCKYIHSSGVTDMFGLSFCYKFENLVVPPSD